MVGYILLLLFLFLIVSIPGKSKEENRSNGRCSCGAHYITHHRKKKLEEDEVCTMLECACCGDSLDEYDSV